MKSKIALVVAIVLAILTAVGLRAYITSEQQKTRASQKLVAVLVAAKEIKKGQAIFSDSVREEEVDQRAVRDGRTVLASDARRVMRKKVVKSLRPGEMLTWAHFLTTSRRLDPAEDMPEGYRQIAIPVDKVTGCAGRLLPGTTVDVLVTLRLRKDANSPVEPVTQTVLTGMRVVATDLRAREVYEFLSARERRDYATYSTVTLRALPGQANLLAFLADQGKMHLVIRRPDDATAADPSKLEKVTIDNLDTLIRKAANEKPAVPAPSTSRGSGR